jgi:hypothetical protein
MENWERKFNVNPEGEAEEVELSAEEKQRRFDAAHSGKKKVIGLDTGKRTFIVDEKGETEIVEEPGTPENPRVTIGKGDEKRVVFPGGPKIMVQGKEMVWDEKEKKYIERAE